MTSRAASTLLTTAWRVPSPSRRAMWVSGGTRRCTQHGPVVSAPASTQSPTASVAASSASSRARRGSGRAASSATAVVESHRLAVHGRDAHQGEGFVDVTGAGARPLGEPRRQADAAKKIGVEVQHVDPKGCRRRGVGTPRHDPRAGRPDGTGKEEPPRRRRPGQAFGTLRARSIDRRRLRLRRRRAPWRRRRRAGIGSWHPPSARQGEDRVFGAGSDGASLRRREFAGPVRRRQRASASARACACIRATRTHIAARVMRRPYHRRAPRRRACFRRPP